MQRLFAVLLMLGCSVCSGTVSGQEADALERWMSHYYEQPRPEQFVDWVRAVARSGEFRQAAREVPLMVFISAVISQNPERAAQWCLSLEDLDEEARLDVGWAFHNARVPASRVCVESGLGLSGPLAASIQDSDRFDPLAQPAEIPLEVDALWAVFFATGNARAIERVMDVLGMAEPPGRADAMELAMLKGVARWSLEHNISHHARVRQLVLERRAREKGALAQELDGVLGRVPLPEQHMPGKQ